MTRIGIAQVDITPNTPVWLVGYGDRDHKSEGVYQALRAGAVYIATPTEELVIITADLIDARLQLERRTPRRAAGQPLARRAALPCMVINTSRTRQTSS